ncbi:hypothetical protein C4544_02910 [candidate division WS5 bacterium]|uniref:Uncharacterized protein n=1 Tax=candidate division WS5 bacterium TaxID=2093353 RepID=A0A419DE75_9BACT|nr:MAG: hypothetical protein C4544_02910 [candidate division WS5 bacterium]
MATKCTNGEKGREKVSAWRGGDVIAGRAFIVMIRKGLTDVTTSGSSSAEYDQIVEECDCPLIALTRV